MRFISSRNHSRRVGFWYCSNVIGLLLEKMEGTDAESLLRQYLPKGTDLSGYTQRELTAIAYRLNTRAPHMSQLATPLEVYAHMRHHSPVALELETAHISDGSTQCLCV